VLACRSNNREEGRTASTQSVENPPYALDGEGRHNGFGNGIWSSTSYNAAGQATAVGFPGGAETFQYDASSNRMTQWQSTAGSATQTGYLSWNANGTLRQLQIIDTANSANSQTCTNIYDDLARLSSFDCGTSNWGQGFSYDAFGNITKSVLNQHTGVAFNPGYNSATNQVSGFGYDSMGDVIYDVSNGYSYDADGRPVGEGGKYVSYDAFGRAAEINNGGVYTDIVYDAQGRKFAYMNGQTLNQYRVPMVAGMAAVHVHGNPDTGYFQHADWLGSSRFSSTGAGAVVYDRAYAPFGEVYAELNGVATNRSFTGQTSDVIQGSPAYYDFMFRQQASSPGRWLTPDPAGVSAVDIANPQTWNRYAYVGDNPLSNVDPLGLCGEEYWNGTTNTITSVVCPFVPLDPTSGQGSPVHQVEDSGGGQYTFRVNVMGKYPNTKTPLVQPASVGPTTIYIPRLPYIDPFDKEHRLFNTHYCGPGGGGPNENARDELCHQHDDCFTNLGVDASQYRSGTVPSDMLPGVAACNQQLCDGLLQLNASNAPTPISDRVYNALIVLYFTLGGPSAGQCHLR
jgi:RHS repeat-associated protein